MKANQFRPDFGQDEQRQKEPLARSQTPKGHPPPPHAGAGAFQQGVVRVLRDLPRDEEQLPAAWTFGLHFAHPFAGDTFRDQNDLRATLKLLMCCRASREQFGVLRGITDWRCLKLAT